VKKWGVLLCVYEHSWHELGDKTLMCGTVIRKYDLVLGL